MDHNDYDERMRQEIAEQILEAVENLALMSQREFIAVREELRDDIRSACEAVCTELGGQIRSVRAELHDQIEDLRQETKAGFAAVTGMVASHEYRIERIEKKLDIS